LDAWKVACDERNRRKWSQAVINYSATGWRIWGLRVSWACLTEQPLL